MPKKQEEALRKAGRAKGYKGDRLDAFVYGTIANQKKASVSGRKAVNKATYKGKKK